MRVGALNVRNQLDAEVLHSTPVDPTTLSTGGTTNERQIRFVHSITGRFFSAVSARLLDLSMLALWKLVRSHWRRSRDALRARRLHHMRAMSHLCHQVMVGRCAPSIGVSPTLIVVVGLWPAAWAAACYVVPVDARNVNK